MYNIDDNVKLKCTDLYNGYNNDGEIIHIIEMVDENNDNQKYVKYEYVVFENLIDVIDDFLCDSDDEELKLEFFNELDTTINWKNFFT
jgi:hypothetical protein